MPIDLSGMNKKTLPKLHGKIAIGRKTASGWPEKLDHFIFTEPVDPKAKVAPLHKAMTEAMTKLYGPTPKEIRVVLPFDHMDEVFYTNFADYAGTSWTCKSEDGVVARRKLETGEMKEVPCNYETCEWRLRCKDKKGKTINTCKPHGLLTVFILDAPISGGAWRFTTQSYLSIHEIMQTLDMIMRIRGSLRGVEVLLKVRMDQKEIKDENGNTSKQNVPIVSIEVPVTMKALASGASTVYGDFNEIIAAVASTNALPNRQILKELANSLEAEESDGNAIDGEIVDETPQNTPSSQSSQPDGKPKSDEDYF